MSFNFFGKKEKAAEAPHFVDRIYLSKGAKLNACLALVRQEPNTIFITWFSDTTKEYKEFFAQHGIDEFHVREARSIHTAMLEHKNPVFAEHHPMHAKEIELVCNWPQKKLFVYTALDEPLLMHFGSDKVITLMKTMGMKEDEMIENTMVSNAIGHAQKKIAAKVSMEQSANSQAEWMMKNA